MSIGAAILYIIRGCFCKKVTLENGGNRNRST